MKRLSVILLLTVIFYNHAKSQELNILSPEEFEQGWELLFDGETLKGWKGYNADFPKSWEVKEGTLFCTGEQGGVDIMTVAKHGDFDLKFEWKIEKNGNSGVMWHVREGKQWSAPYITGPEYQVHDEENQFHKNSAGSCYDVYEPSKSKKVNPAMEWNSGRIRVCSGEVTYWLNGVMTVNYQLYSREWEEKVANSKWKDNPFFGRSPMGHIDFQNHGNKVWYRNIKIKNLDK